MAGCSGNQPRSQREDWAFHWLLHLTSVKRISSETEVKSRQLYCVSFRLSKEPERTAVTGDSSFEQLREYGGTGRY